MEKFKVMFVCMGNICRSPTAEAIVAEKVKEANLSDRIECHSSGTIGFHVGQPADSRMRSFVSKRGYNITSLSQKIQSSDLEEFDLLVTMDDEDLRNVKKLATSKKQEDKILPFCQFASQHNDTEVPDPYYGGDQGFEHVIDLIEDGSVGLLNYIKKQLT